MNWTISSSISKRFLGRRWFPGEEGWEDMKNKRRVEVEENVKMIYQLTSG